MPFYLLKISEDKYLCEIGIGSLKDLGDRIMPCSTGPIIMVLLIFSVALSHAQPSVEEWNRTFGGSNDDWASSIQPAGNGGYIIVGGTESYGAGEVDAWLIKTDSQGNEKWNKTFSGSDDDGPKCIRLTGDGECIIVGGTESYGAGEEDAWLIKTDSQGNEQWNRTFGGPNDDGASSIQLTGDGGYIIAGWTESYGAGKRDAWLIKTDSQGNEQWNKTFGGSNDDLASSIQLTGDGGYIIAGWTESFGAGKEDAWLIETDSKGNEHWNKTFGGSDNEWAYSLQPTEDNGYILAGWTESFGAGGSDAWLIKTDSQGNMQWNRTFGRSSDDWATSLQATGDGGYIISGWTESHNEEDSNASLINEQVQKAEIPGAKLDEGDHDAWLIKTDSQGKEQWNKTFGGSNNDWAYDIQLTNDDGYIISGETMSFGAGGHDVWLIKTAS